MLPVTPENPPLHYLYMFIWSEFRPKPHEVSGENQQALEAVIKGEGKIFSWETGFCVPDNFLSGEIHSLFTCNY